MRQHRLQLCADHFSEWFITTTRRTIETFQMFTPDEKVLVAVSRWQDSLALWDVLLQQGCRPRAVHRPGIDGDRTRTSLCRCAGGS
jgi:hypothetical protein